MSESAGKLSELSAEYMFGYAREKRSFVIAIRIASGVAESFMECRVWTLYQTGQVVCVITQEYFLLMGLEF